MFENNHSDPEGWSLGKLDNIREVLLKRLRVFLRISPDHGPNEQMINKNLSNPLSLIKAMKFLDKR